MARKIIKLVVALSMRQHYQEKSTHSNTASKVKITFENVEGVTIYSDQMFLSVQGIKTNLILNHGQAYEVKTCESMVFECPFSDILNIDPGLMQNGQFALQDDEPLTTKDRLLAFDDIANVAYEGQLIYMPWQDGDEAGDTNALQHTETDGQKLVIRISDTGKA